MIKDYYDFGSWDEFLKACKEDGGFQIKDLDNLMYVKIADLHLAGKARFYYIGGMSSGKRLFK